MSTGSSSRRSQPAWKSESPPDLSPDPEWAAKVEAKHAGVTPGSAPQEPLSGKSKDDAPKSKRKRSVGLAYFLQHSLQGLTAVG